MLEGSYSVVYQSDGGEGMRPLMTAFLVAAFLVFCLGLFAAKALPDTMDLSLGLELGGSSTSSCGAGYTQLTGSDASVIHDPTGGAI